MADIPNVLGLTPEQTAKFLGPQSAGYSDYFHVEAPETSAFRPETQFAPNRNQHAMHFQCLPGPMQPKDFRADGRSLQNRNPWPDEGKAPGPENGITRGGPYTNNANQFSTTRTCR